MAKIKFNQLEQPDLDLLQDFMSNLKVVAPELQVTLCDSEKVAILPLIKRYEMNDVVNAFRVSCYRSIESVGYFPLVRYTAGVLRHNQDDSKIGVDYLVGIINNTFTGVDRDAIKKKLRIIKDAGYDIQKIRNGLSKFRTYEELNTSLTSFIEKCVLKVKGLG